MLNERKLTERELGKREEAIKGLMSNKRKLVKKYGKDAEKVMYGIATKQAKNKVESMNKEKIRELIKQSLLKKEGFVNTTPLGEPESGQEIDVDTGFSGRADYGAEDKYLGGEDEIEQASANTPPSGGQKFLPGVPTPKLEVEIPTNVMNKISAEVKTAQTAAKAMIDFYDQMSEKENTDFTKNPKFRVALERLKDLAKDEVKKSNIGEIDNIDEKELSKSDKKDLKKIEKALKGSSKAHKSQADRIAKLVKEKLTKKHDVGDFVDDFKKSKAKQFRGKSAKKKKEMAVAAYLAKQND